MPTDKRPQDSNLQDDAPVNGTRATKKGVPLVYADWVRLRAFTGGPLEAIEYLLSERTSDGTPVTCRQRLRAIAEAYGLPLAVTMAANMLWLASAKPVRYTVTKQGLRVASGFDAAPLKAWDSIVDRLEGKAVQRIAVKVQHTREPAAIRAELLQLASTDAKFAAELKALLGVDESELQVLPAGNIPDKSAVMPETAFSVAPTRFGADNAATANAVCTQSVNETAWAQHCADAMIECEPADEDAAQATQCHAGASLSAGGDDATAQAATQHGAPSEPRAIIIPRAGDALGHAREAGGGGPPRESVDAMHVPSTTPGKFGVETSVGGPLVGVAVGPDAVSGHEPGVTSPESLSPLVTDLVSLPEGESGQLDVGRLVEGEEDRLARLAGSVGGEVVVGSADGLMEFVEGCSDASLEFLREAFHGEIRRRALGRDVKGLKRPGNVQRPGRRPVVGDE